MPVPRARVEEVRGAVPYGSIPIGDVEYEEVTEWRGSYESYVPGAVPYTYWGTEADDRVEKG